MQPIARNTAPVKWDEVPSDEELRASDCPRFVFTLNRAYLAEHWEAMLATHLPNLRAMRRRARINAALALALPFAGPWLGLSPRLSGLLAAACAGMLVYFGGVYWNRRRRWLRIAEEGPRFGQEVQVYLWKGSLVQAGMERSADSWWDRMEIYPTRRGYLARLSAEAGGKQASSIYLPQSSLRPNMSLAEIEAHMRDSIDG